MCCVLLSLCRPPGCFLVPPDAPIYLAPQVLIVFKLVGVSLLVLMALLEHWLQEGVVPLPQPPANSSFGVECEPRHHRRHQVTASSGSIDVYQELVGGAPSPLHAPPAWKSITIVCIYLLRTAMMNSGYPLNSSILMDFTPKSQRARWQSLGSIVRFGWCGSAALGGVLADAYGYSHTFLVTAAIQLLAVLIQLLLVPIVPRSEKPAPPADPPPLEEYAATEPPLPPSPPKHTSTTIDPLVRYSAQHVQHHSITDHSVEPLHTSPRRSTSSIQ
jgi:MFS family permease